MKNLVVAGTIAFLSFCGMTIYLRDLEPSILHAQLTFSSSGFESVAGRWSPEALEKFRRHFVVDFVCIAAYSLFGAQLGLRLVRRLRPDSTNAAASTSAAALTSGRFDRRGLGLLPWLLPVAGACDVIENTLELLFLAARPRAFYEPAYSIAGAAAATKFALFGMFGLLVVQAVVSARKLEQAGRGE